jgi:hypothetical protein
MNNNKQIEAVLSKYEFIKIVNKSRNYIFNDKLNIILLNEWK